MAGAWIPEGYSTVSPYLVVDGADREIEFLKEAFDAEPLRRFEHGDGSVMHAELRIGNAVVMLGDAGGEWKAVPMNVHVYVEDVDTTYLRALKAGGSPLQEPMQREGDPDKRGGVKSPGGNSWWIGTQIS